MSLDQFTSLDAEAQKIRTYFQEQECDRIYNEVLELDDETVPKADFTEFCTQKSNEYRTAQSVELRESTCESVTRLFGDSEPPYCVLEYDVVLEDGAVMSESYLWLQNGNQYMFTEVSWSEPTDEATDENAGV